MLAQKTIQLNYNRSVFMELLDSRSIKVTHNTAFTEPLYIDNEIVKINYSNLYTVQIGDEIVFPLGSDWTMDFTFKISQIKQYDGYVVLYSHKRTKSSYFLLPMLGYNRDYFKWDNLFINSYTSCPEYDNPENKYLYVVCKYLPIKSFDILEKDMLKLSTFVEMKQNNNYVIYINKIEEKFKKDVELFNNGKYSELSEFLKRRIMYFHNTDKESEIGQILYKDEKRRKQLEFEFAAKIPKELDLLDKPDIEEILFF